MCLLCRHFLVEVMYLSQLRGQVRLRGITLHFGVFIWELLSGEGDGSWRTVLLRCLQCKGLHEVDVVFILQPFASIRLSNRTFRDEEMGLENLLWNWKVLFDRVCVLLCDFLTSCITSKVGFEYSLFHSQKLS